MAHFDKDVYDRKNAYAMRKMQQNRELENDLTEEQKDALEDICSIRHEIHSDPNAPTALFNSESADHNKYWECIDTNYNDNKIKMLIYESNLPKWDWEYDYSDDYMDYDYDDEIDDDYNEYAENQIWYYSDLIDDWNKSIENYLRKIDEQYGTEYCPTGLSRVF